MMPAPFIPGPSRLPHVGTTIFTVMSALAAEFGAVNLGQGFPDFDCDPALQRHFTDAMAAGHNQYAPMTGVPALRQAVAEKTRHLYGHAYDPDAEITVTAGATQAIMATILALVHPGDEVIVLEPVYDSYVPSIELAGGIPVFVPLARTGAEPDAGYAPDWERVAAAVTARTRLLLLNFPHNPTGTILGPADLRALEDLVARHPRLLLLADEVYEHIVFDGSAHASLATSPMLASRGIVVSSFGKTFHVTGWKIGTVCAPRAISAEVRKVHQFMVFAVNTPGQHALARYLADPQPYLGLAAFYQAKRDRFRAALAATRFQPLPCAGTYFVLASYAAISDLPEPEFAQWLIRAHGVATIPVSVFYDPRGGARDAKIVRLCFAKRDQTLQAALERLARVQP
jgi:methionine aminotransferase